MKVMVRNREVSLHSEDKHRISNWLKKQKQGDLHVGLGRRPCPGTEELCGREHGPSEDGVHRMAHRVDHSMDLTPGELPVLRKAGATGPSETPPVQD